MTLWIRNLHTLPKPGTNSARPSAPLSAPCFGRRWSPGLSCCRRAPQESPLCLLCEWAPFFAGVKDKPSHFGGSPNQEKRTHPCPLVCWLRKMRRNTHPFWGGPNKNHKLDTPIWLWVKNRHHNGLRSISWWFNFRPIPPFFGPQHGRRFSSAFSLPPKKGTLKQTTPPYARGSLRLSWYQGFPSSQIHGNH